MANINYPYRFVGGKRAVASEVNANFDEIKTYTNAVNAEIAALQQAIGKLEERPTREMFDVYFSFKGETPTGAYPLWTGQTITNCKLFYPEFWKELNRLARNKSVPTVSSSAAFDKQVTDYGQCACFFIDTLNGHVRLPKITRFISSITQLSDLGKAVNDQIKSHTHGLPGATSYCAGGGRNIYVYGANDATPKNNYRTSSASGGSETWPKHVKLGLYIQVVNNMSELSGLDVDAIKKELEASVVALQKQSAAYEAQLQAEFEEIKNGIDIYAEEAMFGLSQRVEAAAKSAEDNADIALQQGEIATAAASAAGNSADSATASAVAAADCVTTAQNAASAAGQSAVNAQNSATNAQAGALAAGQAKESAEESMQAATAAKTAAESSSASALAAANAAQTALAAVETAASAASAAEANAKVSETNAATSAATAESAKENAVAGANAAAASQTLRLRPQPKVQPRQQTVRRLLWPMLLPLGKVPQMLCPLNSLRKQMLLMLPYGRKEAMRKWAIWAGCTRRKNGQRLHKPQAIRSCLLSATGLVNKGKDDGYGYLFGAGICRRSQA